MKLIKWDRARTAIAEAKKIDEVKEIRDKMEALRAYAKQTRESLEVQNDIAEIKIRAERRMGEMIKETDLNEGGRPEKNPLDDQSGFRKPKLSDLGISHFQSHSCQRIADVPEDKFEQHIAETKGQKKELTTASVLNLARKEKMSDTFKHRKAEAQTLPDKVFNVIYADPPWQYDNVGVHGAANHHYRTMGLEEICVFPESVNLQCADNSVLFLWVTNPFLEDALEVINAWGFEYKTNIVWVKKKLVKPGSGFYVRGHHELLFICTRGSFTPLDKNISPPISSVIEADLQEHSKKPDAVYDIIERLYPKCNYIELFARQKRQGWISWGLEIQS